MLAYTILGFLLGVLVETGPCKMSPLTQYLTDAQQQTLHQLIVSARDSGANEEMVKESMDEYLAQILPEDKLMALKKAHDEFEVERRGKRASSLDKPEPKKIFDIIDQFTSDYQKFYEESSAVRNRNNKN